MPPTSSAAPPELPPELQELEPQDPRSIGPFTVVGRLGEGGMGVVYGAVDGTGRCVAVKTIKPDHAGNPSRRELFAREAALLARIDAECVPRFLGADPEAPLPWLAAEFVPGRTLFEEVTRRGEQGEELLAGEELAAFAAGTAEALSALHAAGVVHLDVKPGNVMLSPHGPKVTVLDLGIAREVGDPAGDGGYGTPGWTAPERLAGDPGDPAADMFAWGGLVAYAATGRRPFGEGTRSELAERVRAGAYDIDGVPEELRGLVERALSVDPRERPSAVEALDTVLGISAEAAAQARRDRLRALLQRAWTRFDEAGHRPATWAAIAGALAATTSSGIIGSVTAAGRATGAAAGSPEADGTQAAPAGSATGHASADASASGDGSAPGDASASANASVPAAVTAAGRAGVGRGVLAVVAALTVLAVIAGAWTIGRVATDQPILPPAGTEPTESAAAEEPPPAPATQTVEYRGVEFALPADWTVVTVPDVTFADFTEPGGEQIVEDILVAWPAGQAGCAEIDWARQWVWRERDCVHVKILGPGAITFTGLIDSAAYSGRSITEDDRRGVFYPYTQGGLPCPSANGVDPYGANGEDYVPADDLHSLEELDDHEWGTPLAVEAVTVRGQDALYREYPVTCVRLQEFLLAEDTYYLQRSWFLPGPQVLVVDEYGIPELDEAMAA